MFSALIVCAVVLASSAMAQEHCPCYEDYADVNSIICNNTSLTSIPDCVTYNVTKFSIRTPSIPLVPGTIRSFASLEELRLEYFKYPKLYKTFLSGQRLLPFFEIYSTYLEYVDKDWFKYAPFIKTLNLSNNKIKSLTPETFRYLRQLESVALDRNPLTTLPATLFERTSLNNIYLHENRWHCDSEMIDFMQWAKNRGVIVQITSYCAYPVELEGLDLEYIIPIYD